MRGALTFPHTHLPPDVDAQTFRTAMPNNRVKTV